MLTVVGAGALLAAFTTHGTDVGVFVALFYEVIGVGCLAAAAIIVLVAVVIRLARKRAISGRSETEPDRRGAPE